MKNASLYFTLLLCITATLFAQNFVETNQELFENKNIVILGGTGYLGTAIATEVLRYNPNKVILFSRDEVKHFITSSHFNNQKIENVIGDIRDYQSLLNVTKDTHIVFHVAALKRMDMMESNPIETVKTNIIGSINIFNACITNTVERLLFVSTDKACLPINIYGASKFASEKIFTNYNKNKIVTKCIVVRFGNILESTGSVIPIFLDKIKKEETLTLTDKNMTRFIINKKEAVMLIFDALRYGSGGEIFIKKLPAMKIIDLIEILNNKFNRKDNIEIIGLRPGEKIHEVLINESEIIRTIQFREYFIIKPSIEALASNTIDKNHPPIYITEGKMLNGKPFGYCSDQAVITKKELSQLLESMKLSL